MAELVQLPLRGGIEEGLDPKAIPAGTLLVGENCRQDKVGRARKRWGTKLVTKTLLAGGSLSAGVRLCEQGDATGVFDGSSLNVLSEALGKWQTIDQPPALHVETKPLIDVTGSAELVDQAAHNGLLVTVYKAGTSSTHNAIYVTVRELATQSIVLPPLKVTSFGQNPRVCVRTSTSTAYVVYCDGFGSIFAAALNLATLTIGAPVAIPGTWVASQIFDAQIVGSNLFVAGSLAAGVNRIRIDKIDLTDVTLATHTAQDVGGSVAANAICLDASNGTQVHCVYSANSLTRLVTLTLSSMAVAAGPTSIALYASDYVFVAVHDATFVLTGHCPNNGGAAGESLFTFLVNGSSHAISANSKRKTFGLYHPSKPWRVGGRWYCRALVLIHSYSPTSTDGIPGASAIVVEIRTDDYSAVVPPHRHRATLENQTSWYSLNNGGHLTQPAVVGSDVYIAAIYRNREPNMFDTLPVGWNVHKVSTSGSDLLRCLKLGRTRLGVSAAPFVLDGATTEPAGFIHAPMFVSGGAGGGGSGAMAAGTYRYLAVYVWRDMRGVLHRSMPSPPKTVTGVPAGGSVQLKIATASICGKQSETTGFGTASANPVHIEIYRTECNGADFYKLTVEPLYQVIVNDPTAADVTILDTKADANIGSGAPAYVLSAQAQIYTVQELEDVPPSAFTAATVHRGRFAGIASDRRTLCLSKDINEDPTVFPGFHEALVLVFDRDKFALRTLNERLIVFGEDNIDLVEGDGPDATGGQNTWRVAGLQTDVGCTNPKSLVEVPMGLMFESDGDLMLLGSDLSVKWMGRQASDRLAAFPVITSAVLVPDQHEVRFTCNTSDGSSGIVLVFDYECAAWYVRKYYDADSLSASMPIVDADLIDGVYTMLLGNGRVYRESTETCRDAETQFVSMTVEMLVVPFGNQGWHRLKDVQVLGTSLTDHDLTIQIARDFGAAFEQSKTFLANTDVTRPGPLEKARVTVARQKGQAFRVRVSDAEPTGGEGESGSGVSGEGLMLEGLTLWVGRKSGPAKVSASRKG